jgi:iron complex outermembrane receptor protein
MQTYPILELPAVPCRIFAYHYQKTWHSYSFRILASAVIIATLELTILSAPAQTRETGEIAGRVLNEGTGEYLRNATITIVGTNISTVSEAGGEFRMSGVPVGEARVVVSYGGLDDADATVLVQPRQTTKHDFNLTSKEYVTKLNEFVVSSAREGNAKAIMQQKESVNMKSVIASDAFGDVSEGNVGEFLKLMPGVIMDYNEADIKYVRIRGLDPKYTSVLMDGAPVATGSSSDVTQNRAFDFEQISISSIETVELSKTPRPSDAGSALAGVVNLRSKGAFDRKGRRLSFQAGASINSLDWLKKTAGPMDGESYKI